LRKLVTSILLTLTLPVKAAVSEIKIFQNDANPVKSDFRLPPNIRFEVYNMDDVKRAQDKLTRLVRQRVSPSAAKVNVEEAHRDAFFELMNSPEWKTIHAEIGASTAGAENALRYDVKKLPAVIFNDRFVLYGVNSLGEAMRFYNQHEKAKSR
jgi:integrating conjugative element protein (TIGR03757 family)